jgi:hypothetical protein
MRACVNIAGTLTVIPIARPLATPQDGISDFAEELAHRRRRLGPDLCALRTLWAIDLTAADPRILSFEIYEDE